jgi:NAD-dependent dihydropyrimidine dehydrogenase PreA subunit
MRRNIVVIDEELCTGCGDCVPACHEGALRIIEGKARLVSDHFCDGLGACLGVCPEGAITIEEREAEAYDERKVMEEMVQKGPATVAAHLDHLREHGELEYLRQAKEYLAEHGLTAAMMRPTGLPVALAPRLTGGCPGSRSMQLGAGVAERSSAAQVGAEPQSRLGTWPVQLALVPPRAPYLAGADLLVAADCVPFAYAGFHERLLRGRVLLIGCPKLDDIDFYREKLVAILEQNEVRSVTVARMEVPCCSGLVGAVRAAVAVAGTPVPVAEVVVGLRGTVAQQDNGFGSGRLGARS